MFETNVGAEVAFFYKNFPRLWSIPANLFCMFLVFFCFILNGFYGHNVFKNILFPPLKLSFSFTHAATSLPGLRGSVMDRNTGNYNEVLIHYKSIKLSFFFVIGFFIQSSSEFVARQVLQRGGGGVRSVKRGSLLALHGGPSGPSAAQNSTDWFIFYFIHFKCNKLIPLFSLRVSLSSVCLSLFFSSQIWGSAQTRSRSKAWCRKM